MRYAILFLGFLLVAGCGGGNTPAPAPASKDGLTPPQHGSHYQWSGIVSGFNEKAGRFVLVTGDGDYKVNLMKQTVILFSNLDPATQDDIHNGIAVDIAGTESGKENERTLKPDTVWIK